MTATLPARRPQIGRAKPAADEAFRAELREWLRTNLPGLPREPRAR